MAYMTLSDDLPIAYRDEGTGRAIVLLQGLMLTHEYFWQKNRPAIVKTNRLVTFDHRSHGLSGKPLGGHTIAQCADDLKKMLDRLDLTEVTLGGVAFGARVMFEYLRRYGAHRLAKLAVIEAQVRLTNAPGWDHPTFGNFPAEAGAGFIAACRQSRAALAGFLGGAFSTPPDEATMRAMTIETWMTPTAAVIEYIEDMLAADYRDDIATLSLPTVFMYGRNNNQTLPTELGRWLHARAPGSQFIAFERSGHSLFWEEPEKFNRELVNFANA
jgi:pimeloyl-ACP methyl ester carboxylesterase